VATKYNSTQQLLEKYSPSPKPPQSDSPGSRKKNQGPQKPGQAPGPRTNIAPPPTANIQRPSDQQPSVPQRPPSAQNPTPAQVPPALELPGAEFAPNAFSPTDLTKQYSSSTAATFVQPHWYDRILDALLGEDETQPKNRLALICSECRLVNGQAPPGTRTIEDIGRWRCGGCNAWNGKEKVKEEAVASLVQGWEAERKSRERDRSRDTSGVDSDDRETEDDVAVTAWTDSRSAVDIADESIEEDVPPARSTRSKSRGKGKK